MPSYAVPHDSATMGAPPPGSAPEALSSTVPQKPKATATAKRSTFPVLQPVSKADLEWGKEQLNELLGDRPQMQAFVEENDPIWNKAVRGFAGETTGKRIEWNDEGWDKPLGYFADHVAEKGKLPRIRLAKLNEYGKPVEGERLWSGLMYEFNNLANTKAFEAINQVALEGRYTKKEWMNQVCYVEYRAFKPTMDFYNGTFGPLMSKRGIKSRPVYWRIVEWRDTYPAWIAQFRNPRSYPYTYWGNWWDQQIYPQIIRYGNGGTRAEQAVQAATQKANLQGKPQQPGAKQVNAGKPAPGNKQPATKSGAAQRSNTSAWNQPDKVPPHKGDFEATLD